MSDQLPKQTSPTVVTLEQLAELANYSLMDTLNCDPDAKENGADHLPRQVFTGHYVPVNPTPIKDPEYIAHSKNLFRELGFAEIDHTDGLSMNFGDWRFNLRASNTEPVVRLNVESRGDQALMEAKTAELLSLMKSE